MTNIGAAILLYVIGNIGFLLLSVCEFQTFAWVNPIVIYDNVKMNWVGVILTTIILHLLFPAVAIPYWIYKLLTVGRK